MATTPETPVGPETHEQAVGMYVRLSLMMFLEFAVWGAWSVLIAVHMNDLGFSGIQIGLVFGTTAFGAVASPLITGWLADRVAPAQVVTAFCHLLGAVLLFVAWKMTTFQSLWVVMFLYAMTYMPTIALTNGIAFHHMGDSDKFGNIRVWGTIGWIAVQWFIGGAYLRYWEQTQPGVSHAGDVLLIAGIVALVMGFYCFSLPSTPPAKGASSGYAFLEAFRLTRDRNFLVLLAVSFVVAIELPWYYNLTPLFFTQAPADGLGIGGLGLQPSTMQLATTIGQVFEILMMLTLFWMIRKAGMRWTIFVGILAWPLRYLIFAVGEPTELVIASQALHGVAYTFFFAAGMVAAERLATPDLRASAQSLVVFATNGLGMLVGHFLSGTIHDMYRISEEPEVHHWAMVFALPIVVTTIAAIAFIALWNEARYRQVARRHDAMEPDPAVPPEDVIE